MLFNFEKGRMSYSIADIKASYPPEKRHKEVNQNLLGYIIYRQISFLLTPLFLKYSISANSVTFLTLLFIPVLPFIPLIGLINAYIYIALLCFMYHCLDYVDGNIARVTKTSSRLGMYMDSLFGNLYWISVYISIGLLVDQTKNQAFLFAHSGLCMGLITGIIDLVAQRSRLYFKLYLATEKNDFSLVRESPQKIIRVFTAAVPTAGYLIVPLLLITGYLSKLYLTLAFAFLLAILMFVYSQVQIIRYLTRKNERKAN